MKWIVLFALALLFASCANNTSPSQVYSQNTAVADKYGKPAEHRPHYFPDSIKQKKEVLYTQLDTFYQCLFSSNLYAAAEPVLYNSYLGHDIYRFLWLRAGESPHIFSLHKDGNEVWMNVKQLLKQPDFIDMGFRFMMIVGDDTTYSSAGEDLPEPDWKAKLMLNKDIPLTKAEWSTFEQRLNNSFFWTSLPVVRERSSNSDRTSEWVIEAHLKESYWFLNKQLPTDNFKKAGEYLISLSGVTAQVY